MYGLSGYFGTFISAEFLYNLSRTMPARRTRRSRGLFSKIYGPVSGVIGAVNDVFGTTTNTVKGVVHTGLRGVNRVGQSVTGRANKVVRNLVSRKNRKSRGGRRRKNSKSSKSRKNSKSSKNRSRKSRRNRSNRR